ncbi:MAG: N-acetylmuramoyl-L-alanine amidase [Oscillospiraceae bacterium]|jgi:N-acetylmuramoyl-L-alanine amidase|nr:N-acetylmuramoyl-L-alanine amidase [Oscillospiraceae bacterium]
MPKIFLSPSTQYWNVYVTGGDEREYTNIIADKMIPYLDATGIQYVRNNPEKNFAAAIADSNSGNYDAHFSIHSNAAPEHLAGKLRGIDVYYAPGSELSTQLALATANNLKETYPLSDKVGILPTTSLGEVISTKAPSVLAELGYHDNYEDVTWLKNNMDSIARALVKGLAEYFGIPFVEPSPMRTGTVTTEKGTNLNMREKPSVDSPVINSIPSGANVAVYGETNGWYVIGYGGMRGYASKEFISVNY